MNTSYRPGRGALRPPYAPGSAGQTRFSLWPSGSAETSCGMVGVDTRTFHSFQSFVRIGRDPYGSIRSPKRLARRRGMAASTRRISPARPRSFSADEQRSRRRQQRRPPAGLPTPDRAASPPPSTPEPEHVLLDQIAAGELDAHLVADRRSGPRPPRAAAHDQLAKGTRDAGRRRPRTDQSPRHPPLPAGGPRHGRRRRPARRRRLRAPPDRPLQKREIRARPSSSTASTPPPDQRATRRQPL